MTELAPIYQLDDMKEDFEHYITESYGVAKAPQLLTKVGPSTDFVYTDSKIHKTWIGYQQGIKDATERLTNKKTMFSNNCNYSAFNDTVCNKCGELHKLHWYQVLPRLFKENLSGRL